MYSSSSSLSSNSSDSSDLRDSDSVLFLSRNQLCTKILSGTYRIYSLLAFKGQPRFSLKAYTLKAKIDQLPYNQDVEDFRIITLPH